MSPTASTTSRRRRSTAWNVGVQHKVWHAITFDIAYVGSKSEEPAASRSRSTRCRCGARSSRRTRTRPGRRARRRARRPCPPTSCGRTRATATSACGMPPGTRTTTRSRRRSTGGSTTGSCSRSSTSGARPSDCGSTDLSAKIPNASDEEIRRVDYSYADYDRPHNFVLNFIYQTPKVASGVLGVLANDWQISGIYRWTSGRPYAINFSIPGIGNDNLTGGTDVTPAWSSPVTPAAAGAATPTSRSTPPASPRRSPAATATSRPGSSCTARRSATSTCRSPSPSRSARGSGSRCASTPSTRSTTPSSRASTTPSNFASLTDPTITNLPYDASGNLVRNNGFGSINGVAPPRTLQLVTRLTF